MTASGVLSAMRKMMDPLGVQMKDLYSNGVPQMQLLI